MHGNLIIPSISIYKHEVLESLSVIGKCGCVRKKRRVHEAGLV